MHTANSKATRARPMVNALVYLLLFLDRYLATGLLETVLSGEFMSALHVFYFISNSIFGFRLELLRAFLVFSFKVAYELLSIILA